MIRVECYSGVEYAERPVALTWENQRLTIEVIERQWREPDGPAFRVRAAGGRRFELHYNDYTDAWTIHPLSDSATPA